MEEGPFHLGGTIPGSVALGYIKESSRASQSKQRSKQCPCVVSASATALSSCLAFLSHELFVYLEVEDEIIPFLSMLPFVHGVYQSNIKVVKPWF